MLAANPFIRLFEAPVETLTLAGYLVGLLALIVISVDVCGRNALTLFGRWNHQRHRDWVHPWVPPTTWSARLAAIPLVVMLDLWAIAGIIYLT